MVLGLSSGSVRQTPFVRSLVRSFLYSFVLLGIQYLLVAVVAGRHLGLLDSCGMVAITDRTRLGIGGGVLLDLGRTHVSIANRRGWLWLLRRGSRSIHGLTVIDWLVDWLRFVWFQRL